MTIVIPDSVIATLYPILHPILWELLKDDFATRTELQEVQYNHDTLKAYTDGLPERLAEAGLVQGQVNATLMLKDGSNSTIGGGLGLTSNDGVVEVVPIPPEA